MARRERQAGAVLTVVVPAVIFQKHGNNPRLAWLLGHNRPGALLMSIYANPTVGWQIEVLGRL